jgi:hypothetical protein
MIEISPLPSIAVLEQLWRQVADGSEHSFFLSWPWISTWLRCIQPRVTPMLLTASRNEAPVAAAIMVRKTIWRRHLIPTRTWILNATGDADLDSICIEYNGLLSSAQHGHAAWTQVLDHFSKKDNNWDEIQLDAIAPSLADAWVEKGLPIRQINRDTSRFLELDTVRATPNCSCLGILAPRARTKLRRTIAGMDKRYGALTVSEAATTHEAHQFLSELKTLHTQRWSGQPTGGAFIRPFFETFHRELIERHFDTGVIQLVRAKAGATTLGFLYNFVHQGRILFYQSGIDYTVAGPGESPGLLLHALVIDHNAKLGHAIYDMLAGDSQYKRTFANLTSELWWGALQAPRLKLKAEQLALAGYRILRRKARNFRGQ